MIQVSKSAIFLHRLHEIVALNECFQMKISNLYDKQYRSIRYFRADQTHSHKTVPGTFSLEVN